MRMDLIVIDPQMDFCVPDGTFPNIKTGALLVDGAYDDMKRLAGFIRKNAHKLSDIHVTLDSHHLVDVAHPLFWKDTHGKHPSPFTVISASDIEKGVWTPSVPSLFKRMVEYAKTLESSGRYLASSLFD
jgi:nicotinamidase/pyrazinamidase